MFVNSFRTFPPRVLGEVRSDFESEVFRKIGSKSCFFLCLAGTGNELLKAGWFCLHASHSERVCSSFCACVRASHASLLNVWRYTSLIS